MNNHVSNLFWVFNGTMRMIQVFDVIYFVLNLYWEYDKHTKREKYLILLLVLFD